MFTKWVFISYGMHCLIADLVLKIINSVTISDLEVIMTEQSEALGPLASSQYILATYKNPFGFSLQVVQAAEDIIIEDAAEVCFSFLVTPDALMEMSWCSLSYLALTLLAAYPLGTSQISTFPSRSSLSAP
jgi:hypothetical protein